MAHVQTVLGPVDPGALGVTLPHEHTQIALWHIPDRWDYWQLTRDPDLIAAELGAFREATGLTSESEKIEYKASGPRGEEIVITQPTAGDFKGFSATCTHAGCTVNEVVDGTINCPCHGSKFNLDGSVANGPATKPLASEAVSVQGNSIVLG